MSKWYLGQAKEGDVTEILILFVRHSWWPRNLWFEKSHLRYLSLWNCNSDINHSNCDKVDQVFAIRKVQTIGVVWMMQLNAIKPRCNIKLEENLSVVSQISLLSGSLHRVQFCLVGHAAEPCNLNLKQNCACFSKVRKVSFYLANFSSIVL